MKLILEGWKLGPDSFCLVGWPKFPNKNSKQVLSLRVAFLFSPALLFSRSLASLVGRPGQWSGARAFVSSFAGDEHPLRMRTSSHKFPRPNLLSYLAIGIGMRSSYET